MLWKLEFDEYFLRIYDRQKLIAGYFDPDFGDVYSKENSEEIISSMIKNHDVISGGMLMVPLVKFGLFDTDLDTVISKVEENVLRVNDHLKKWRDFLSESDLRSHSVRISHTDQDMLTISFQVFFSKPVPLEQKSLQEELFLTLNSLQKSGLL